MVRNRLRGAIGAALIVGGVACGSAGDNSSVHASAITQVTGNGQIATVGTALQPLEVLVSGASQEPVANATVTWSVTQGSAKVSSPTTVTDANGHAQTTVTLGTTAGTVLIKASVSGTSLSTQFSETANAASNADCTGANAILPAAGGVTFSVETPTLCLSGGTGGADYAVIPFNTSTNAAISASAAVTVTGQGVTALSTPNAIPSTIVPVQMAGGLQAASFSRYQGHARVDSRLRATERRSLSSLMSGARTWMRRRSTGALRDAIPANPQIGDLLRLNGNSIDACTNPSIRTGRVVAISNSAIVVADTANPAGGFTTSDYQSFATTFDTLVNPLDTTNFGAPSDIDGNHRELIFFTRAVNELTQPNSGEIIGGFFFARDLFPQTSTDPNVEACPTSNVGEMFYMQVPDPNGVVNGNKYTVAEVEQFTLATLAHEYQHLINASRRLYITNAPDIDEVVYLNEGLSHIAEELLFYRTSGLAPLMNIDVTLLRQKQAYLDDFNNYQLSNQFRYMSYLESPSTSSPYADDDSLKDRGAIWGFLRWASDHKGGNQVSTWRALVNSQSIGLANLQGVFGSDILQEFRDYATSLFADDVPGVTAARALQPSWNQRSITPALAAPGDPPYPLKVLPLANGTPQHVTLRGGGSAYVRFTVPAGTAAEISWSSAAGGGINIALVRSR